MPPSNSAPDLRFETDLDKTADHYQERIIAGWEGLYSRMAAAFWQRASARLSFVHSTFETYEPTERFALIVHELHAQAWPEVEQRLAHSAGLAERLLNR